MDRITFDELSKALTDRGWTNWTLIAFTNEGENKIFSSLTDEENLLLLADILQGMVDTIKNQYDSNGKSGSC